MVVNNYLTATLESVETNMLKMLVFKADEDKYRAIYYQRKRK